MKKLILKIIQLTIFILIQELVFSIFTIQGYIFAIEKILFSMAIAVFVNIITTVFSEKINRIIYNISVVLISLIYMIYAIFFKLLNTILSIDSIRNGLTQATEFGNVALNQIFRCWYIVFIFLIPTVIMLMTYKYIKVEKDKRKKVCTSLMMLVVLHCLAIVAIEVTSTEAIDCSKNYYYYINNPIENVKKFGLLTTIRLDLQRNIFPFEEKRLMELETENGMSVVIDEKEYNITEVNFDDIKEKSDNQDIQEICEYLKKQMPTNKNNHTGRYKGKNLIVFVAESFSNLAIREDLTPTLYKMANTGIKFNNFYTPLFPVSTADGEYLTDTSLLPAEGIWSIENVEGKTFPYTYGNIFQKEGYKTYAYHNYDYQYYKRDKYFPTMGYQKYLGQGNGLENKMDFSNKPASDYDMVKSTIDDYLNDEHFVAYYMTMSGHIEYNMNHAIVRKNWDKVQNLPYSDKAKAYLATQIELDKALEETINKLSQAGKLQDTVIIVTADHYPYGLTYSEMQELSDEKMDYEFSKFHMPFLLYQSEDREETVEKYSCSLDVLPTVLNLFGIEYDSRLLMGKDIFSNSEQFVIFSDRSYICEKGKYNAITEKFEPFIVEEKVDNDYLKSKKEQIYYCYRYSRLILKNDFYKYLN